MRRKLIELRKKKKYTQEDMAKFLNIARSTYSGYEIGSVKPSLDVALRIKKLFRTSSDDIFLNYNVSISDKE